MTENNEKKNGWLALRIYSRIAIIVAILLWVIVHFRLIYINENVVLWILGILIAPLFLVLLISWLVNFPNIFPD